MEYTAAAIRRFTQLALNMFKFCRLLFLCSWIQIYDIFWFPVERFYKRVINIIELVCKKILYKSQGSHAILKELDYEISFQDLEKVLNLAKIYMKYWKSIEIVKGKEA